MTNAELDGRIEQCVQVVDALCADLAKETIPVEQAIALGVMLAASVALNHLSAAQRRPTGLGLEVDE